jgi:hypothetical protein
MGVPDADCYRRFERGGPMKLAAGYFVGLCGKRRWTKTVI